MNNTITTSINGNEKTFVFNRQEQPKQQQEEETDFVYFFINGKIMAVKNKYIYIVCSTIVEKYNLPTTTDDNSIVLNDFTELFSYASLLHCFRLLKKYKKEEENIFSNDFHKLGRARIFFEEMLARIENGENIFFAI